MAELQTERSFVVELTPEGVQEIQSHKNIYTEDTKPIPLSGREWSTKNYITLWTGILVSIPVYIPGGFRRPHPDHSQRRSHCLGLLAGQSEGRICRTVHHSGGRRQRRELLVSVLPLPDFHDRL